MKLLILSLNHGLYSTGKKMKVKHCATRRKENTICYISSFYCVESELNWNSVGKTLCDTVVGDYCHKYAQSRKLLRGYSGLARKDVPYP